MLTCSISLSQVSFRSSGVWIWSVSLNGRLNVMWSRWTTVLRHELTTLSRKLTVTPTRSTSWSTITPTGTLAGMGVKQKSLKDVLVQPEKQQSSQVCLLCFCPVTQCILQQLRQRFGSGGPGLKLPTGQRCSKHPNPPRHLLPLCSSDAVHPHQPLQRDPLALCVQ